MRLHVEWSTDRAIDNLRVHGVRFDEAATVFGDPFSRTIADEAIADTSRFVTLGLSERARMLVLSHVDRGDTIWILAALRALRAGAMSARPSAPRVTAAHDRWPPRNFSGGLRGKYARRYWESTAQGMLRRGPRLAGRGYQRELRRDI
jgi:uncharacterized DUF497 family protein